MSLPASTESFRSISQALLQEHDGWLGFAALSGPEGTAWVQELRQPEILSIVSTAGRALPYLRRSDLETGRDLLAKAEEALTALPPTVRPSVLDALQSIFQPLLAYFHYCRGDYTAAGRCLDEADRTVAEAIRQEPFLMPLAFRCSELELHRARIARNRRHWDDMHRSIETTLAMVRGERPFCTLPDGFTVTLSEVQKFFRGLPPVPPELATFARQLTDDRTRLRMFDVFVLGVQVLPGFVIPQA